MRVSVNHKFVTLPAPIVQHALQNPAMTIVALMHSQPVWSDRDNAYMHRIGRNQWAVNYQIAHTYEKNVMVETKRIDTPVHAWLLEKHCPYRAGMKLWVRESYNLAWMGQRGDRKHCLKAYESTDSVIYGGDLGAGTKWSSPARMPQWASRLELEITSIASKRVHDVTVNEVLGMWKSDGSTPPLESFRLWWDHEQTEHAGNPKLWESNPFVWVLSVKTLKINGGV